MSSAAGRGQGGGRTRPGLPPGPSQPRRMCPLGRHSTLLARVLSGAADLYQSPHHWPLPSGTKSISRPRRGSDYRKRRHPPAQMLQNAKWRKPRNLKGIWAAPPALGALLICGFTGTAPNRVGVLLREVSPPTHASPLLCSLYSSCRVIY